MMFKELEIGGYFTWVDKVFRKVAKDSALDLDTEVIVPFDNRNRVEKCDKPLKDLALVSQYLDWAMLEVVRVANPNCKKVIVEFDLVSRHSVTRFIKNDQETK